MAKFEVPIVRIDEIKDHPKADKLELAIVGGFQCVVRKDQFVDGDKAVYIPEQAIVPEPLLKDIGLWLDEKERGMLTGPRGDRVKIVRLRGEYSQGILIEIPKMPRNWGTAVGTNLATFLNIKKYEPVIPPRFEGEIGGGGAWQFNWDVQHWNKHPDIIPDGCQVTFTEKLHGTFQAVVLVKESERRSDMIDGKYITTSKGYIGRGLYLKDVAANKANVYVEVCKRMELGEKLEILFPNSEETVALVGETYGVQKGFNYDTDGGTLFRAFGLRVGPKWLDQDTFFRYMETMEIPTVPILYDGPFSEEKMLEFTDGLETINGEHMREGIVINPKKVSYDPGIGRVVLKSVSKKYLMRASGDEIN